MSALLDLLVAAPWDIETHGPRHDIIALGVYGERIGFIARDIAATFAEHIVDNHNRELARTEACGLCSPARPGEVRVDAHAYALAACGGDHG